MNKTDFRRLFRYSDNCWILLGETLANDPRAAAAWETPFETTSKWKTVRLLLAHCIGAEERWITRRLQNLPLPVLYEERAAPDWSGIYRDHRAMRAATLAYLDRLTEADLADEAEVCAIEGIGQSRADVLFHLVNHENYHRGQAIMALQRLGVDPPNFDYCLLKDGGRETDG